MWDEHRYFIDDVCEQKFSFWYFIMHFFRTQRNCTQHLSIRFLALPKAAPRPGSSWFSVATGSANLSHKSNPKQSSCMGGYERTALKYSSLKQTSHKQCKSPCPQTPLTETGLREPLLSHPDKLLAETQCETYKKNRKHSDHSTFRALKILTHETTKSTAKFCNAGTRTFWKQLTHLTSS